MTSKRRFLILTFPLNNRSPSEVTMLKDRIRDWAAAHGCLDDWNNENYEFLFKVSFHSPLLY